jgi:hypothetical protein
VRGYIALGEKKRDATSINVKDFFVTDQEFTNDRGRSVFDTLISYYYKEHEATELATKIANVVYPAPLFNEFPNDDTLTHDDGTMYRVIDTTRFDDKTLAAVAAGETSSSKSSHVFFGILSSLNYSL